MMGVLDDEYGRENPTPTNPSAREIRPDIITEGKPANTTEKYADLEDPFSDENLYNKRAENPYEIGSSSKKSDRATGSRSRGSETANDKNDGVRNQHEKSRDGKYLWPVSPNKTYVSSKFGPRRRNGKVHHDGIDAAPVKSLPRNEVVYVRATADGTVLVARDNVGNAGNLVNITHEKHGTTSRYAHNDKIIVREGQAVKQGDIISTMGNTGDSDGKHLHFELRQGLGGTKSTTTPIPIRESDFNKKFNYMD